MTRNFCFVLSVWSGTLEMWFPGLVVSLLRLRLLTEAYFKAVSWSQPWLMWRPMFHIFLNKKKFILFLEIGRQRDTTKVIASCLLQYSLWWQLDMLVPCLPLDSVLQCTKALAAVGPFTGSCCLRHCEIRHFLLFSTSGLGSVICSLYRSRIHAHSSRSVLGCCFFFI